MGIALWRCVSSFRSVISFLENLLRHTKMTVVGSKPPPHNHTRAATTTTAAAAAGGACTPEEIEATQQSLHQMRELLKLARECSVFSVNLYSRSVFGKRQRQTETERERQQ